MTAALQGSPAAPGQAVTRRAFVEQVMGLPVSIHVRGPHARSAVVADAVALAYDALRADDALFSTYRADSPVSRIRLGELRIEDAGPRVGLVARLCDEAAERSGGYFSAWLPDSDGVRRFDPTGLVKGWAVEQAATALAQELGEYGAHDLLVCAGGDILARCARTDTPDWQVAVEDPRDRTRTLTTFGLRTGAVATSGTAARGAHIVDPHDGRPALGLLSVTVVGPSLTWADVYATAAFARGQDAVPWLATLAGHAFLVVDHDGRRAVSQRPGAG